MAKVGIVTDTTNCLPPELIKEYEIKIAPMTYTMEGKTYRDGVDITQDEFYKIYKTLTQPTTSTGVTTKDFLDVFKKLKETTNDILTIVISDDLSATYKAALMAKDIIKGEVPSMNIEVIDSRTVIGALGFIVLEAARAAKAGMNLNQVVEITKNMMHRVHWLFMLETLKYLIQCGRAPKFGGWVGELLNIKPIMGMSSPAGVIQPMGRVRGKNNAIARLVQLSKKELNERPAHVIVHFAEMAGDGEKLKEMISSELNCAELYVSEFTPIMLLKTGPLLGLSFYA
ncbi:DegV family protein [Chloroflexota bacterium]